MKEKKIKLKRDWFLMLPRKRVKLLLISMVMGLLAIVVLPLPDPMSKDSFELSITATGNNDSLARGSNVIISDISRVHQDGTLENLFGVITQKGWISTPKGIVSQKAGATINIKGSYYGDIQLKVTCLKTNSSGIASFAWDNREEIVSLYSQNRSISPHQLVFKKETPKSFSTYLFFIFQLLLCSSIFFIVLVYLTEHLSEAKDLHQEEWSKTLLFGLPCLTVSLVYLYAFWPAIMTYDSSMQWRQAISGQYTNGNPFFHTVNIRLLTLLWKSPASIILVQILWFSSLVGFGAHLLRKSGAPEWSVWSAAIMTSLSPFNSFLIVTMWKDIFYGLSFFTLSLLVFKIILTEGRCLKHRLFPVLLGLIAAFVALYRHNGPPVAMGTIILIAFYYRRYWRRVGFSALVALILCFAVQFPLANMLDVQQGEKKRAVSAKFLHKISAHIKAGTSIEPDEFNFLSQFPYYLEASKSDLSNCKTRQPLKNYIRAKAGKKLRDFPAAKETKRLALLFWNLTWRNPMVTLKSHICGSSWMWRVIEPYRYLNYGGPIAVHDRVEILLYNKAKASNLTLRSQIRYQLFRLKKMLYGNDLLRSIFLKDTLFLYLFIFSIIACCIRANNNKYMILGVPIFFHWISLFLVVSHTGFRYMWPVHLTSVFFFLPLMFLREKFDE